MLYAYLGEMMPNRVRTKLMVLFGSFIGLAVIFLCGIGWLVNYFEPTIYFSEGYILTPWRIQWLICLIPGIFAIFLYSSLPESPQFLASIGNTTGALIALKEVYERNNSSGKEFPVKSILKEVNGHGGGAHKNNL